MSLSPQASCRILEINANPAWFSQFRRMIEEYLHSRELNLWDEDIDAELNQLETKYRMPQGRMYLALKENQDGKENRDGENWEPVGCVAFYAFAEDICELKRLYVSPQAQGLGLGRALMTRAMQDARAAGYRIMRLDSLRRLQNAAHLYPKMGFYDIPPYNDNPFPDVYHMEALLAQRDADFAWEPAAVMS